MRTLEEAERMRKVVIEGAADEKLFAEAPSAAGPMVRRGCAGGCRGPHARVGSLCGQSRRACAPFPVVDVPH